MHRRFLQNISHEGLDLIRTIMLAIAALFFISGCSGYRTIEVPIDDGEWTEGNVPERRMYTPQEEGKYVIKPEPYSLKSKKKDPELLGPQRTYNHTTTPRTQSPSAPKRVRHSAQMTKASCISMIGEAKYNSYVKKYGSEKGALRRCLILKRLKG